MVTNKLEPVEVERWKRVSSVFCGTGLKLWESVLSIMVMKARALV